MLNSNPFTQFGLWFDEAGNTSIDKPNAMVLSTVNAQCQPGSRVVLLSSYDERGFVFHTNYQSHKGEDIASNPTASLLFWWDELGYQVRIDGSIKKTDLADSDAYFAGRPRGSQIGAWASEQSHVIAGRPSLEQRVSEFTERFEGQDVPRPPHWGGYRVIPQRVEFWINQDDRLHDRYQYTLQQDGTWEQHILAP